jgi:hypothetical protein
MLGLGFTGYFIVLIGFPLTTIILIVIGIRKVIGYSKNKNSKSLIIALILFIISTLMIYIFIEAYNYSW